MGILDTLFKKNTCGCMKNKTRKHSGRKHSGRKHIKSKHIKSKHSRRAGTKKIYRGGYIHSKSSKNSNKLSKQLSQQTQ